MVDVIGKSTRHEFVLPRVLADFGGRRKIFERRLNQQAYNQLERRSGKDRRSGFDRRSAYYHPSKARPEKRSGGTSKPIAK